MSKHTPGPWRVVFGNRLGIHGPKDEIGWPKPIVYNAGLCTDEEAQANAQLIAAAPELLEALEDAWKEMAGWSWTGSADRKGPYDEHRARIRAAIAKAKGETK